MPNKSQRGRSSPNRQKSTAGGRNSGSSKSGRTSTSRGKNSLRSRGGSK